ncbi:NfeD family protein [Synechococcus sp. CS-602]|uniref:NfeD family protein n=1 Tax=Synechococcaceae TaxID=1890426 RepID=UPI0008FF2BE7|nr:MULTISPECIES: NfeD family protein [Synechococcaceae]MCT4363362.1 NfeD family protein [Candidatus Regnicoccus frigidus MAG-AL1]APD48687.1 hypothetical protein BM449_11135 [Synechococcus sp. SynAce01]MCT0205200.1 NfeD family protein [Synechococcus sp. CS-602]MCT0245699.1 NfeD family protein [Synechococcus sp. CS-601]MCT4368451.1 NfeD family protein [Candidatus Regnicoccus frigidus MAG-AL2]
MIPLIWLVAGGGLLLLEWIFPSIDGLLIGAVAALLLSALTALWPGLAAGLQLAGFLVLFLAGYGVLRRWSLRGRLQPDALSSPGSERAEVIQAFNHLGKGRVRWQGQSWRAELLEAAAGSLAAGDEVVVLRRVGTRLEVLAAPDP